MSKVLQERGFGSLPSSTKANPRDQVGSISTTIEADSYPICRIRSNQYTIPHGPENHNTDVRVTILFSSRFGKCYYSEKRRDHKDHKSQKLTLKLHISTIPYLERRKTQGVSLYLNNVFFDNALVDLRASISVMPLSTYLNLRLGELAHTKLTVELADRTLRRNQGDDLMPTIEEGEVIEIRTKDDELDTGIDDYPSYCERCTMGCWKNDRYCNGGNLPGTYIVGNSLHYQDYEWYEALMDCELKEQALRNKAIMEGLISDDESCNDDWRRWESHETTYHSHDEIEYENETHDERQELCEAYELPVCNIRRFKMIKYSFGQDEEYVAVKEDEDDDLAKTSDDACRAYQEIFRMMDEGCMTSKGYLRTSRIQVGGYLASFILLIMEYLVNISKRRAFWSLNEDILKITILTTNTPYPSRKIRRIRACTHQRPQRKLDQYAVSSEDQYAVLEISLFEIDLTFAINAFDLDKGTELMKDNVSQEHVCEEEVLFNNNIGKQSGDLVDMSSEAVEQGMDDHVPDEMDGAKCEQLPNLVVKKGNLEFLVCKQVTNHGGDELVDKERPLKRKRVYAE
ncbi:hypothetical protein Tco_0883655 [Tanacetum coccineum]